MQEKHFKVTYVGEVKAQWQDLLMWKEMIGPPRHRELAGSSNSCPQVLTNPPCILLIYKTSSLSFQLPNLFSQSCAGSAPIQSISWIFRDIVPLSCLILFLDFPRLGSSPLWLPFWLLLCMPQSSASSSGFYCARARQRDSPLPVLLPLPVVIWASGLGSCHQRDWKLKFPACSVINISLAEDKAFP